VVGREARLCATDAGLSKRLMLLSDVFLVQFIKHDAETMSSSSANERDAIQ
jgi:hypothetical protein